MWGPSNEFSSLLEAFPLRSNQTQSTDAQGQYLIKDSPSRLMGLVHVVQVMTTLTRTVITLIMTKTVICADIYDAHGQCTSHSLPTHMNKTSVVLQHHTRCSSRTRQVNMSKHNTRHAPLCLNTCTTST